MGLAWAMFNGGQTEFVRPAELSSRILHCVFFLRTKQYFGECTSKIPTIVKSIMIGEEAICVLFQVSAVAMKEIRFGNRICETGTLSSRTAELSLLGLVGYRNNATQKIPF